MITNKENIEIITKESKLQQLNELNPVLMCQELQETPLWIGFGCVSIGSLTTRQFTLVNPQTIPIQVSIFKYPKKFGIQLYFGEEKLTTVTLQPNDSIQAYIIWESQSNLSLREDIILQINSTFKLTVTVHGFGGIGAVQQKPKQQPQKKTSGIKLNRKILGKTSSEIVEDKNLPANNSYDNWAKQQILTLTQWINFKVSNDSKNNDLVNPFLNVDQKYTNKVDSQDIKLILESPNVFHLLSNIKEDISQDKIQLRNDQNIRANICLKEDFTNLLLSYDPYLLYLVLEVIFTNKDQNNQIIENNQNNNTLPQLNDNINPSNIINNSNINNSHNTNNTNTTITTATLNEDEVKYSTKVKKIIHNKILNSDDIYANYSKPGVVMTPFIENKYLKALNEHTLELFLTIIIIMDQLWIKKTSGNHFLLFQKTSSIKSTRELLITFCHKFLKGEGNILKHFANLGFISQFTQTIYDEFNFYVNDISTDLRDGIRLIYLLNILLVSSKKIEYIDTNKIRIPATSRLQKLHNVNLVLDFIKNKIIQIPIESKNIVDGNLDSTLLILWILVFEFDLKFIVTDELINNEIIKINPQYLENIKDNNNQPQQQIDQLNSSKSSTVYKKIQNSLLNWINSITIKSNIEVTNFSSNLINGRIICIVIHYYYPNLISEELLENNSNSIESNKRVSIERKRFNQIQHVCQQFGGIPSIIPTFDSIQNLNEKVMTIFLGFLFIRLKEETTFKNNQILNNHHDKTNQEILNHQDKNNNKVNIELVLKPKLLKSETILTNSTNSTTTTLSSNFIQNKINTQNSKINLIQNENKKFSIIKNISNTIQPVSIKLTTTNNQPQQSNILEENQTLNLNNEILLKSQNELCSQLQEKIQNESRQRLLAEQRITELESLHAESIKNAQLKQQFLEQQLQDELEIKYKLMMQYETEISDEIIRNAEENLWKQYLENLTTISSTIIQRFYRKIRAKKLLQIQQKAILLLQNVIRIWLKKNKYSTIQNIRIFNKSTIKIQKWFQNKKFQLNVNKFFSKIRIIKHFILIIKSKFKFQKVKSAIKLIQKIVKKYLQQIKISKNINATQKIQKCFKLYIMKKNIMKNKKVLLIQNCWNTYLLRKRINNLIHRKQIMNETKRIRAATKIFKYYSSYRRSKKEKEASIKITNWYLTFLPLLRIKILKRGFYRLLATRRAVLIRRNMNSEVQQIYQKIKISNENAKKNPQLKLANITENAILLLNKGKAITHFIQACQSLEMTTHYSKESCKKFIHSSSSKVLFTLICSCNRSSTHQELLRCALQILVNVTIDPRLTSELAHNGDTTELLIDLMQMFRDKSNIFLLSCELLTRLITIQSQIKDECLATEMKKRLDGIFHILERKHRLDMRVKIINSNKSNKSNQNNNEIISPFKLMQNLMEVLSSS